MGLDAHRKPPEYLQAIFKKYRRRRLEDIENDAGILDLEAMPPQRSGSETQFIRWSAGRDLRHAFAEYLNDTEDGVRSGMSSLKSKECPPGIAEASAFYINNVPGLVVFSGVIPTDVQKMMLSRILHRDLSNPKHLTNVHMHHKIEYPGPGESFFDLDSSSVQHVIPKDPDVHNPMSVSQFMNKKLRWITLGGQYDWTNKVYPTEVPPSFPRDMQNLLQDVFPLTRPEAAIVNLYSPGDTLSLHRDVAEESEAGLISISIGCDALFVIGLDESDSNTPGAHAVVRLRSGDAVYMSDQSRFAWHGVCSVIPDSCTDCLKNWPSEDSVSEHPTYETWRGWMQTKRININVRQMH